MSSSLNRIKKNIIEAMHSANNQGTSAYDSVAEVRRVGEILRGFTRPRRNAGGAGVRAGGSAAGAGHGSERRRKRR